MENVGDIQEINYISAEKRGSVSPSDITTKLSGLNFFLNPIVMLFSRAVFISLDRQFACQGWIERLEKKYTY